MTTIADKRSDQAGQPTLPLFDDVVQSASPRVRSQQSSTPITPSDSVSPHLQAARRLARRLRRLPDLSPEQTRTGQAICHHLKAMLKEHPRAG